MLDPRIVKIVLRTCDHFKVIMFTRIVT